MKFDQCVNHVDKDESRKDLKGLGDRNRSQVDFGRHIVTLLPRFIDLPPDEVEQGMGFFLKTVGEFNQANRTYLAALSEGGKLKGNAYEWCAEGIEPQIKDMGKLLLDVFTWKWDEFLRFESINIPRVSDLPPEASVEREILQALGIQSLLLIPLSLGGVCAGLMGLESVGAEKAWAEEEIGLLKGAGEAILSLLSHKQAETSLKDSLRQIERIKKEWEAAADSLSDLVFLLDSESRIIRANRAVEKWSLCSVVDVRGRKVHDLLHPNCPGPACTFETYLSQACGKLAEGHSVRWEFADRVLKRYLSIQVRPVWAKTEGKTEISFAVVTMNDTTQYKKREKGWEKLIRELEDSLAKRKSLYGTLPICASCKKIRDEDGNWKEIEGYIGGRTEAQFSHGFCPECAKRLYPDFFKEA